MAEVDAGLHTRKGIEEFAGKQQVDIESQRDSLFYMGKVCCIYDMNKRRVMARYRRVPKDSALPSISGLLRQDSLIGAYLLESEAYHRESIDRSLDAVLYFFGGLLVGGLITAIGDVKENDGLESMGMLVNVATVPMSLYKLVGAGRRDSKSLERMGRAVSRHNSLAMKR